ncbi:hypothetical protein GCM10010430_29540 [Kitasatospora cystarginea]|uniref:Uncharacterized protein n=1 Tax=Kitasatospora cystarginea TaxID=58350 RepID=A0ABN3E0I0_9ACTN
MWLLWGGVIVLSVVTVSRGFLRAGKARMTRLGALGDPIALGAGGAGAAAAGLGAAAMALNPVVVAGTAFFWGLTAIEVAYYARHHANT